MNLQVERHKFIEAMRAEGVPQDVALLVLRHANTIQRLSVAECNGDYPCDNGERKVEQCGKCDAGYVRHYLKGADKLCPGCRAAQRIAAVLEPYHVGAIIGGDPRGACVKLKVPSGKTDDWGREGLCVPTREY